jgi:hypothetical protein
MNEFPGLGIRAKSFTAVPTATMLKPDIPVMGWLRCLGRLADEELRCWKTGIISRRSIGVPNVTPSVMPSSHEGYFKEPQADLRPD